MLLQWSRLHGILNPETMKGMILLLKKSIALLLLIFVLVCGTAFSEEAAVQQLSREWFQIGIPADWQAVQNEIGWNAVAADTGYEYRIRACKADASLESIDQLLAQTVLFDEAIRFAEVQEQESIFALAALCVTEAAETPDGMMKTFVYAAAEKDCMFSVTVTVPEDVSAEEELLKLAGSAKMMESAPYIGNRNTKKFHYAGCNSVKDMKEKNKEEIYSRDYAINEGYVPCKRCNP